MAREPKGPPRVADYETEDVHALKALSRGDASAEQQRRALNWIISRASMGYEDTFVPDPYESAFNQGRRSVALQTVKLINLPVEAVNLLREQHGRRTGPREQP